MRAWASGNVLTITTFGSSSCPSVPSVTAIAPELARVKIQITRWARDLCTTDISARTFELEVERGLEGFTLEVEPGD